MNKIKKNTSNQVSDHFGVNSLSNILEKNPQKTKTKKTKKKKKKKKKKSVVSASKETAGIWGIHDSDVFILFFWHYNYM